ncbi:4-hydroxythreonine-4-phosphate dehydrogenase [Streptomyces sp. NBC_01220]|uniref:four-carbon acid sugar kinase family protein n=1 Tax=Streptomyces sp. NBC_01220 TaxID=2903781 RepID=UPI00352D44B6|nr:4-hydroxythreonine-4-phosphate dehydrogenase [Streptomyces sp. NBC_01220]
MPLVPFEGIDDEVGSSLVVLADDLSGAAECAALLPCCRAIDLDPSAPGPPGLPRVIDLDSRRSSAAGAALLVAHAVHRHEPDGRRLVKKADSLLRGHFAPEARAFGEGAEGLLVITAVPAAGRTVRDGVVRLHGVPLHRTDAWQAEPGPPPRSVAEALGAARTVAVRLDDVRAGARSLEHRLRSGLAAGTSLVCDAETDADLDALAEALLRLPRTVRTIGAGGIVAALGRRCAGGVQRTGPGGRRIGPGRPAPETLRPVVVVVGTAHRGAAAQIAQLSARGAQHLALPAASLITDPRSGRPCAPDTERYAPGTAVGHVRAPYTSPGPVRLPAPVTVFSIARTGTVDPSAAPRLVHGLCRAVAGRLPPNADLVLTGGETARTLLDALAVTSLLPVGQVHHGAVLCRTPQGRGVVIRPGSHGGQDSLVRMVEALLPDHNRPARPGTTPRTPAGTNTPSDGGPR